MPADVTQLLIRVRGGDQAALDELMPVMYSELRRIARAYMLRQRLGHTLQATALVNEAYLKLFGDVEPHVTDRNHFLALMSRVMRQVLVDHARAAGAAKRGGPEEPVPLETGLEIEDESGHPMNLLDLHRALDALQQDNEELARVVELHYFGGMTAEEVATAVDRSVHVVRHELRVARAWLRRELDRLAPQ